MRRQMLHRVFVAAQHVAALALADIGSLPVKCLLGNVVDQAS